MRKSLLCATSFVASLFTLGPLIKHMRPWITSPGKQVWELSNWLCPPYGERCVFFLSEKILYHHLWGIICYVGTWWVLAFMALELGRRALAGRSRSA